MSTQVNTQRIDNPLFRNGGSTWTRLHYERDEICSLLLDETIDLAVQPAAADDLKSGQESSQYALWTRRALLQARLRLLDDALDRLMAGAYGECSNCGRWIEDTRLDAD